MPVTNIYTDQTEYCRYLSNLSVITTTILVSSPFVGANLSVALFRLDGYGSVATKTVTQTTATSYTVTFDLNKDAIDTLDIYRAKQGDYVIQVTDSVGAITQSVMFAVSIVSVWELKNEWLKGITLWDYEVLEPRVQPQNITGVTVTEVSENHMKGPCELTLTIGTPSTLSWGGGQAININRTSPQSLLLQNLQQDFIMVDVNPALLPAVSTSESLYIDNGRMKDSAIIDQMRRATDDIHQKIVTCLEPTIYDTDPGQNGYYDEVGMSETYYKPKNLNKWMSFKLPTPNLLNLESITGYFNTSQAVTMPREWLVWNEKTSICELVPSTNAVVAYNFYNSVFSLYYLLTFPSIPGFWHYRVTAGLRDLWNERAIVREAIAKKCATEILLFQGSSYRAGYASQETSRDGVNQSQNYTSSAMYGTFAGHYSSYQKWLTDELPKMRTRFCGIQFVTI